MIATDDLVLTKKDIIVESRLTQVETLLKALNHRTTNIEINIQEGFKEIRVDFKWLFGIMLTMTGVIFTLLAKGFHWFPL